MTKIQAFLAVALLSVGLGLNPDGALADAADRERCTCDLAPGDPPRHGASVKNASACWTIEDQVREWCDIVVESLGGSSAGVSLPLVAGDAQDRPAQASRFVEARFQRFIETYAASGTASPMLSDLPQAEKAMGVFLERHGALLADCLDEFGKDLLGRGFHRESSEGVTCQVGERTGWLRLRFALGGMWLSYLLAPPGGE